MSMERAVEAAAEVIHKHPGSPLSFGENGAAIAKTLARAAITAAVPHLSPTMGREQIARVLYDCERKRADHTQRFMQQLSGKECPGAAMEPWEECKDSFLSDADAILSLSAQPPDHATMRAFSASDAACYLWPDGTDEHKTLRAAYIRGAADCSPTPAMGREQLHELSARVHGALADYASLEPEEDETWESWFHAAFDLAGSKIGKAFDDALSATHPPALEGWQDIASAPNDSDFRWYGLHVKHRGGHEWFEAHYIAHDDNGQMIEPNGDGFTDWSFENFEFWCNAPPLPAPPLTNGERNG